MIKDGIYGPLMDWQHDGVFVRSDYGMYGPGTGFTPGRASVDTLYAHHAKEVKFDVAYLRMAQVWAGNSHAERKKVGCLIVRDFNVISDGYNGTPSGFDNKCEDENGETKWEVLHAEANAIMKLAKSSQSCAGATLYITFSPCRHCAKMILQAGIVRVVYTERHSDEEGLELLARAGIMISQYNLKNLDAVS